MEELWHLTHKRQNLAHNVFIGKGCTTTVSAHRQIPELKDAGTPYQFLNRTPEKERIWEEIREREYPDRPPREGALFAFDSEELAKRMQQQWFSDEGRILVRLHPLPGAQTFRADAAWLDQADDPGVARERARRYWAGESTDNPLHEVVVCGRVWFPDWQDWAELLSP